MMFGRYDGDWNDNEAHRVYLVSDRKCKCRKEIECTAEEIAAAAREFMGYNDLDHVYVYEMVEMGQYVPDEDGVEEFLWMEDMV
jgi:hypothetical protein